MNTKRLLVALASITLALAGSSAFVACSSDDNANPAPNPLDASSGDTSPPADSGPAPDTGSADTSTDADSGVDANCTSDAATCNSCVTPQTDPLHACSPATANCIPFSNSAHGVPANVPTPQ